MGAELAMTGRILAIHIAPTGEAPMIPVSGVRALAGLGLEGDRYALAQGSFSGNPGTGREVTLIEVEALRALVGELGLEVDPALTRRNLLTEGVALNHLVGREFRVGQARLRGMRLCEPCKTLARTSGKPAILPGLIHRGGLRCDILEGGEIRVGDEVSDLS